MTKLTHWADAVGQRPWDKVRTGCHQTVHLDETTARPTCAKCMTALRRYRAALEKA